MSVWSKKEGFCESKFRDYEVFNIVSSLAYCLAAAVLVTQICTTYSELLKKWYGFYLALFSVPLFLLGLFSGVFHGSLYKAWGRADCALILQVCLYIQTYICLRISADSKRLQHLGKVSALLLVLFLFFLSYLLNTLSFSFGFGRVFSYMVGANVALIALLLFVLWLVTMPSRAWRRNFFLLVLSFFLFVTAALFWHFLDQHCLNAAYQAGHPLWHVLSALALYVLLLFLVRLSSSFTD